MEGISFGRILLIAALVVVAHLAVGAVRSLGPRLGERATRSPAKVRTLTGFVGSVLMFVLYFVAIGLILQELGVSLKAYLASASVIGLAVSFGSQGIVQDVIMGLTVVISDLLDVGDMVEIAGQVGIVERVGIRFTVLINFAGARVYIPNRTVTNVTNYPKGYVRAFIDVRLPASEELAARAEADVARVAAAFYEQLPGILLVAPTVLERERTAGGYSFVRVKFRIWPGQGAILEGHVRQSIAHAVRQHDPGYADWMVAVHYRAEPKGLAARRLPRPATIPAPAPAQGGAGERKGR